MSVLPDEVTDLIRVIENPETWIRVSKIVIGGVLVITGIYMLANVQLLPVASTVAGAVKGAV